MAKTNKPPLTTVAISRTLHKPLRRWADRAGYKMQKAVDLAVKEFLERNRLAA